MAVIKINDLRPAGSDLFNDSENYLNELNEQESNLINGGIVSGGCIPVKNIITFTTITIVKS